MNTMIGRDYVRNNIVQKLIVLLAVFVSLSLIPGCHSNNGDNSAISVPMNVKTLTLTRLWEEISQIADIPKETAVITSLHFGTDGEGNIELASYSVSNMYSENQCMSYSINVLESGILETISRNIGLTKYDSYDTYISRFHNAEDLFRQIDSIGLSSLQSDSGGMTITLSYVSNVLYTPKPPLWVLFELMDGTLVPLDVVQPGPGYSTVFLLIDTVNPDQPIQMWFLSEDLANAEVVRYSE